MRGSKGPLSLRCCPNVRVVTHASRRPVTPLPKQTTVDGRLRGTQLSVVARLAAATPSLQRLRLRGLRLSSSGSGGGGGGSRRSSDCGSSSSSCRTSDSGDGDGRSKRASDCGSRRDQGGSRRPRASYGGGGGKEQQQQQSSSAGGPARDEAYLCGMLEALPALRELDLGRPGGHHHHCPPPLPPSVLGSIARLPGLVALTADASSVRDGRCGAALLAGLPALTRLALRVSAPDGAGGSAFAMALCSRTRLEHLDLESPDAAVDFASSLRLSKLARLQTLSLGLCPSLPKFAAQQVSQLPALHKLTLPFCVDADVLRALSDLPALSELYTWSSVELEGAAGGPPAQVQAQAPLPRGGGNGQQAQQQQQPPLLSILALPPVALRSVTKLVASSVLASALDDGAPIGSADAADAYGARHELDAVFPSLRALYLRRAGDGELRLAAGCGGRLETLVLHGAPRATDGGVALLRRCRGIARLQVEDAPGVTDAGFQALFPGPAPHPSMQHLALHRLPLVGDAAMQAATAACRRLASASLACCPGMTDRTLSRMARMERLGAVQLVRLGRGVTAEGVRALASAPAMQTVLVAGCPGVRASGCRQHRPGVRVRVDDEDA